MISLEKWLGIKSELTNTSIKLIFMTDHALRTVSQRTNGTKMFISMATKSLCPSGLDTAILMIFNT